MHLFFSKLFFLIGYCCIVVEFPVLFSRSCLIIYFKNMSIYVYVYLCVLVNANFLIFFLRLPLSTVVSIGLFSKSGSLFLLCKVIELVWVFNSMCW